MTYPVASSPMPQAPALINPRQLLQRPPQDDAASVRATAEQFASLLIEQVVSGLHQGAHLDKDSSFADEAFETMLDQHLAQQIARSDGFGLTAQISTELGGAGVGKKR